MDEVEATERLKLGSYCRLPGTLRPRFTIGSHTGSNDVSGLESEHVSGTVVWSTKVLGIISKSFISSVDVMT